MPDSIRHSRKTSDRSSINDSGLLESVQRFWQRSYAGDYLGLALLVAAYIFVKINGEPFHSQFRLDDPRLQHPHAEIERVNVVWLFVLAGILPLGLLIIWSLMLQPGVHKTHLTILGLVISILVTTFITDILKDAIGRPRPDLIARCKPDPSTPKNEMVTFEVCTETNQHVLHDGWRSYPSGHSSFSFAGLGWIAFLLASQTHVLRPRASLAAVLLCFAPLLGATLIAVSRLEDYRHDVFDVVSGSTLGILIAYFNWRRYYPSLLSQDCSEPYSAPSGSSTLGGFQRVRDEEEGHRRESVRYNTGDD